tara:strand:+ start:286 stop:456 length:171 start_codon:yes stop_codon:yes gene_type:complete
LTVYSLQYWNERAAEWRGTGSESHDLQVVKDSKAAFIEEMGGFANVRFRILEVPAQ